MQPIQKKRATNPRGRMTLLLGAAILLLACLALLSLANRPEEQSVSAAREIRSGVVYSAEDSDVAALRITLRSGESWQLTQSAEGVIAVDGDEGYQVARRKRDSLLAAAAAVTYEQVLTEDASAYAANFADFGLDKPRIVAEITYRDGKALTLRIGNDSPEEDAGWSYMTIDGDPRLYALDSGTADNLAVEKADLHPVEQPVLHKVRFDRITFTAADGKTIARWELEGGIGGDADDRWRMTEPLRYPADGEAMGKLKTNLENLRLGAYVGQATPENLTAYGFDSPRFIIEIHMAEGSIGTTGSTGVYDVTDWPESSFTLTVGAAKNDAVDYVRVGDGIYLTSHFTLGVFMDMDPRSTLTRYVVPSALGNLQRLTVETSAGTDVYSLVRTERVAENNELVYDEEGQIVYDVRCERNGEEISYTSFEAAYRSLMVATVSGMLPGGWTPVGEPHTRFTFLQSDGAGYTVELADYDAFHDAVLMDGSPVFYLIKGGMKFYAE